MIHINYLILDNNCIFFISFENKWYIKYLYWDNNCIHFQFNMLYEVLLGLWGSFWVLLTTSNTYKNLYWDYNSVYSHFTSFIKSFWQPVINLTFNEIIIEFIFILTWYKKSFWVPFGSFWVILGSFWVLWVLLGPLGSFG